MSRRAIYCGLILLVCAISAVAGISASNTGNATLPAPQNVTLSGMIEGIDVRWNIPPGSGEVANYQIAYQAMERQRADSWTYMWTQGKVTAHLIRHLAGGYEYRVYVRSCSTRCNSEWAYGGTVWTQKPRSVTYNPVPIPTPKPTPTPTSTPTPQPKRITLAPQLIRYVPSHTPQSYLVETEYRMRVIWTSSPTLQLEVTWREAQSDTWTTIGPDDFSWHTLLDLKPATDYEAKSRHWHPEYGYGPWSDVYTLKSADEPAPLVVCEAPIKGEAHNDPDITHISSFKPTYLGIFGSYHTTGVIRFTNPESTEWEYGFKVRTRNPEYLIVVKSDQAWEVQYKDRVLHSGTMPSINLRPGETNEVLYSTRGGYWGYFDGLWVNGEWAKFNGPPSERGWVDLIVVWPRNNVGIPVTKIRWGDQCE